MSASRTLVTGFGPFLQIKENPSGRLAQESGRKHAVLEVAFRAVDEFIDGIDADSFDRLVMVGVAATRQFITPELFARNHYAPIPDVHGEVRELEIEPGAPLLVASTLWAPERLCWAYPGHPTRTSCDAGGYLCNYIAYRALRRFPEKHVGFLHIPTFEQLPLKVQVDSLNAILTAVEH